MRAIVSALLMAVSVSPAAAELWESREGECREWRARWNVGQDQDGIWRGTVQHVMVGGSCNPETGARARSDVEAIIAGESFFAARRHENGSLCSYYGRIQEDRVRGFELCEGSPTRMPFALRFPPGDNLEARQRYQGRDRDEWLDDPRTLDRNRPPSGFELDFRRR